MDLCREECNTNDSLLRKCIHLLITNRSMNSILSILIEHIVLKSSNTYGLIGERRKNDEGEIYYRYHAIYTSSLSNDNEYMKKYYTQGYFDIDSSHKMHTDINIGQVYINNTPDVKNLPGHPPIEKTIFLPLHDTNNSVIGVLGLSGPQTQSKEIYDVYVEMCSYILQLALERMNMNHHKNLFLANISNALRSPINGIISVGKVSSSSSSSMTPMQKQYIDTITFYSLKLLDLINDIQDYTRMSLGTLHLVNKSMSLSPCINMVRLITQQKTDPLNVQVKFNYSDLPDIIIADEVRLTQILVNLLDNSCKYTKKGTISMSVNATKHQNGWILSFIISDTGIGMTEEQLHNIFNSSISNSGLGLGLHIVRHLIDMFQGHLQIKSELGKGTTVTFDIFVEHKIVLSTDQIKSFFTGGYALVHVNLTGKDADNSIIFEQLSEYGIRPVMSTSVADALQYTKNKSFANKFNIIIFGNESASNQQIILKRLKPDINIILISPPNDDDIDENYYPLDSPITKEGITNTLTSIITNSKETETQAHLPEKGRILIAEDDIESQQILIKLLNKLGYHDIDVVSDGLELYIKLLETTATRSQSPQSSLQQPRLSLYPGTSADPASMSSSISSISSMSSNALGSLASNSKAFNSSAAFDIVFVTLSIPILDGIKAIKKYRQTISDNSKYRESNMLIIAVSSSITQEIKTQCYAAGINGYILKPINIKDLEKIDNTCNLNAS